MYDRVFAALERSGLSEKYKKAFEENEMNDVMVQRCLDNEANRAFLSDLIRIMAHRLIFLEEFRKTSSPEVEEEQQQQNEQEETSMIACSNENFTNNLNITTDKYQNSACSSTASSSFFNNTTNNEVILSKAHDTAMKLYTRSMNNLLGPPRAFYEPSVLKSKHEEIKSQALEDFTTAFKAFYVSSSSSSHEVQVMLEQVTLNDVVKLMNVKEEKNNEHKEELKSKLAELSVDLEKIFEGMQEKNELKESNYTAQAKNVVGDAEKLYSCKMNELMENCNEEDELIEKEKEVNKIAVNHLNANICNPFAKQEFMLQLNQELKESISKWFEEHLELFQLRLEEDEIVVREALFAAKNYYNEEMDKNFISKAFIPPSVLKELDKKISIAAMNKCKDLSLTAGQKKQLEEAMKVVYKKYEEKNIMRRPTSSYAIGIDLGTTYSCVAVYRNGKVEVIHNENGNKTTPSFVSFLDDGSVVVGDTAKDMSYKNPENTIFDAKRLIGRKINDEKIQENMKSWPFKVVNQNGKPKIKAQKNTYYPEQISAQVLKKMKKIAEDYLGVEVKNAVITVPALFSDSQRQSTRDAGEIAGLNVLRIINEPTAAAIAYNLHRQDDLKRNVLVFDLGGGTFDVVVLQMTIGEINVKAVHGDTYLGGQDFDTEMVNHCIEYFKKQNRIDLARGRDSHIAKEKYDLSCRLRRMLNECERQKRVLSSALKTTVGLDVIDSAHPNLDLHVPFTRDSFQSMNKKYFDKCIDIVKLALDEAKMSKNDINDIILVGGSTRIPLVQKMLSDFFDGKVLSKTVNPDEVVAEGAAIQACILNEGQYSGLHRMQLQDVIPFSIGIENFKGEMHVEIPKNTPIPCCRTNVWQTTRDYITTVCYKIYEGEHKIAKRNNLLGSFNLVGLPPKKAGEEPMNVTTTITEEGILHVKATCASNGKSNDVTIKAYQDRMSRKEIEKAKASMK